MDEKKKYHELENKYNVLLRLSRGSKPASEDGNGTEQHERAAKISSQKQLITLLRNRIQHLEGKLRG